MASFAERMAALKAASAPAPVVAPEPIAVHPVVQGFVDTSNAIFSKAVVQPAGINPPSGVPEGQPVLLGEFDPDRQSRGPFLQNGDGEWVALKSMKKPELRDAVKLLAGRVKAEGLSDKFAQHMTAHTLDLKQIAADAKTTVDGLRSTAGLLIQVLAGDDETALRRAGVEALPEIVAEHRRVAVAIERDGGSRAEALVKLLKDGRSEEFVRLVNVSFEAPLSEDLLARTIAVVPNKAAIEPIPDVQAVDEPDGEVVPVPDVQVAVSPEAIDEVVANMTDDDEPDIQIGSPKEAVAFEERIKTLEKAASWAMHEKKDVYEHLVTINKTFPNPLADNAVRSVVASLEVNTKASADAAVKLVQDIQEAVRKSPEQITKVVNPPILAVGCEIAGPLLMQDFERILSTEFEPKIAKKTGSQYGQAAYSEDYKLMAGLVEHYGKKAFAEHSGGVMTLNSFRRDRQYILDGLARAGWIILNGRG